MSAVTRLVKGGAGKPLHPPLTDASIGAYAAGVVMLVLGALGVEERQMAHGALLAISFGLVVAAPTALTGLLDWLDIPKGTPARQVATIHMLAMVAATVLFALTWLAHLDGYKHDQIEPLAVALGVAAFVFLAVGGNVGGANVFVYGVRVLKRPEVPPRQGLNPLGVSPEEDRAAATRAHVDRLRRGPGGR